MVISRRALFYEQDFTGLVVGKPYTTNYFIGNILARIRGSDSLPDVTVSILNPGGAVLATNNSGDIPATNYPDGLTWLERSLDFTATTTDVTLRLSNAAPGGSGNDLVLDDIGFAINCINPVAVDNVDSTGNTLGTDVTVPVLNNDSDADGTLVLTSVVFTGDNLPPNGVVSNGGKTLTVPEQGVWTIAASGEMTFAPDDDFFSNPTPVEYKVFDNDGLESNPAIVTIEYDPSDYSDAPTTGTSYGVAQHNFAGGTATTTPTEILGATWSSDAGGYDSANASADASDDGVLFASEYYLGSRIALQTGQDGTTNQILATGSGTVHAWIDLDQNGTFDADEYDSITVTNGAGQQVGLMWDAADVTNTGTVFARFRYTNDPSVNASTPSGAADDGEVEDYQLTIVSRDERPALPFGNCVWNWSTWNAETNNNFVQTADNAFNPTSYNGFREAGGFYTSSKPRDGFLNGVDETTRPVETAASFTAEHFYGIGSYVLVPGTTKSFTFTDADRFEGHAIAVYNSAGNIISRNPATGYYASETNGNINSPADGGTQRGSAWNETFSFTVPADGQVYVHYLMVDEGTRSRFGTTALCEEPTLETVKSAEVGDLQADGTVNVTYEIELTNTGEIILGDLSLLDNMVNPSRLGGAFVEVVSGPTVTGATAVGSVAPLGNVGFDGGGTDAELLAAGGVLAVDDSLVVTVVVKLDPNDPGAADPLANSATAEGTIPGTTTSVTDNSENSTDADNDGTPGTDPDGTDDDVETPTIVTLPTEVGTIGLVKTSVLNDDDGTAGVSAGDTIDYTYVVTNTSTTVNVFNVTVDEPNVAPNTFSGTNGAPTPVHDGTSGSDLDSGAGTATDIAPGETVTFTASYTLSQEDINAGMVDNSAVAEGTDPAGNTPSDTSDSGNPADGDGTGTPGTGAGNDDPTSTPLAQNPELNVTKGASVGALQADGTVDVTYTVTVANTGNVTLDNLTLVDDLTATDQLGSAFNGIDTAPSVSAAPSDAASTNPGANGAYDGTDSLIGTGGVLAVGDAMSVTFVVNVDPNAGGAPTTLDNTATATATPPGSAVPVSDDSDTTTDPAGAPNGEPGVPGGSGEPTVITPPSEVGTIGLVKTSVLNDDDGTAGVSAGDTIDYTYVVTNTSTTVNVFNVTVDEPNVAPNTFSGTNGAPTPVHDGTSGSDLDSGAGTATDIAPGETVTFTASYTLSQEDINAGMVDNSAVAEGTDPAGNPVTDTSDDDNPATGNDDPTVTPLVQDPEISLIKSIVEVIDSNGDEVIGGRRDEVVYEFAVTNTGNLNLINVEVDDPKLGGVLTTIASLPIGATETFQASYIIKRADQLAGFVENTATATGTGADASGDPLLDPVTGDPVTTTDRSDTGTDSDQETIDDPEGTETPDNTGATDNDPTNDPTVVSIPILPNTGISGTFFLDNNDNGVLDDGDETIAGIIVQIVSEDGEVIATTTTDADGFYEMTGFPVGTHNVEFIDPVTGEVVGLIEGLLFENDTVLEDQDALLVPTLAPNSLILTKSTPLTNVMIGTSVPYTITAENEQGVPVVANLVDTLPPGLVYTPDTGRIDGVMATPIVSGSMLTWRNVLVGPGETVTLELMVRVGPNTPTGDLTNTVRAFDPTTGTEIATPATATVRRHPEAVFECSDIIGKVFDDVNRNGYQDGPFIPDRAAITDQTYVGGKLGEVAPEEEIVEPGLPGVRLITTSGLIITTDEYGRFNVPCAALPGDIGANFTLKVDDNSLPTGYRMTTENPRTMRVTAGIMTEMNFGASIGRVVDVDLTASAFGANNQPVPALVNGIAGLLSQVRNEPSIIRITYFRNGESDDVAQDRLNALEAIIRDQWRGIGNYRLEIERTVALLQ